jgi:D-alanyl-D-alanine carboxypeptidase/D-alanyl-D-alanine-endopeptidase (penicillin-binding protein 4)
MITSFSSRTALLLATVLFWFNPGKPGLLNAGQAPAAVPVANLIQQGGYALAPNDRTIIAENSDIPFVPASTLKIITSLAALDILGPDYRFPTRIFRDNQENLYIKGGGDPFLLTENITAITHKLHESGLRRINNLVLDDTALTIDTQADGNENSTNPYDAWNSGLAVNFNAIAIRVTHDHAVSPDDPKVPLLPMMRTIGATLPPGHYHLNVNAFASTGQLSNTQRYSGELFAALLQQEQITMRGEIMIGKTPSQATPVLTSWSDKTVRDMIQLCLKYSNNFVANQLFLACGAAHFGAPATWEKGRNALRSYIQEKLKISESELVMVEGSGLSRLNRITPKAMITALQAFVPYKELLSVKKGIPLKSGTLTGVYCYAGYIPQQQDAPFVILLNQPQNNRDEILHLLTAKDNSNNIVAAKINTNTN